jgi:hypothetical protein
MSIDCKVQVVLSRGAAHFVSSLHSGGHLKRYFFCMHSVNKLKRNEVLHLGIIIVRRNTSPSDALSSYREMD